MPYGLPSMGKLGEFLRDNMQTDGQAEEDAWILIRTALANGDHLEAALEGKALPNTLLEKIVSLTWQCVNEKDMVLLNVAASTGGQFALGRLLAGMFNSTQSEIHVVTTQQEMAANGNALELQIPVIIANTDEAEVGRPSSNVHDQNRITDG